VAFGPDGEFVVAVTKPEEPRPRQQRKGGKLILWGKLPGQPVAAKGGEPPAQKAGGDDLPAGAVARVGGTPRFLHPVDLRDFAVSPDGKWLATAGGDATPIVWDLATGRVVRTLTGHKGMGGTVEYSPDGK
jgi:WD40 repeat protein